MARNRDAIATLRYYVLTQGTFHEETVFSSFEIPDDGFWWGVVEHFEPFLDRMDNQFHHKVSYAEPVVEMRSITFSIDDQSPIIHRATRFEDDLGNMRPEYRTYYSYVSNDGTIHSKEISYPGEAPTPDDALYGLMKRLRGHSLSHIARIVGVTIVSPQGNVPRRQDAFVEYRGSEANESGSSGS